MLCDYIDIYISLLLLLVPRLPQLLRADLLSSSQYSETKCILALPFAIMVNDTGIVYFNKDSAEYGFMSNMYIAPFTVEDVEYKSTEHYFQAAKARHFKDHVYRNPILARQLSCID